jgi:hypothetical protein
VPLIDQVPKMREYLAGHALNMVPESVKEMNVAFDTLRSRYGDEERVLNLRIGELKRTGPKPEKDRDQVIWYTDLEGKIQQLLDLGSRSDDMGRFTFGPDVFRVILNLFPTREHLRLGKFTKDRLQNFKTEIASFRQTPTCWTRTGQTLGVGGSMVEVVLGVEACVAGVELQRFITSSRQLITAGSAKNWRRQGGTQGSMKT